MLTDTGERTQIKAGDLIFLGPENKIGASRPFSNTRALGWFDKPEKSFSFLTNEAEFEELCQAIADACNLSVRRFRGHPAYIVYEFY